MVLCKQALSECTKKKYIILKQPGKVYNLEEFELFINNHKLDRIGTGLDEESTKFLGVLFDEHLSWKPHINYLNNKIARQIYTLKQCKHMLDTNTMRTLYFSLIHPHITYGILAWGSANKSYLQRTNILHKRAIRMISKSHYNSHTEPIYKKLNILNIYDQSQCELEVQIFMHKLLNKKLSP